MPFPMARQVNLWASSLHCPFNAERQAEKLQIRFLNSLLKTDSKSNHSLLIQRQTLYPLGYLSCFKAPYPSLQYTYQKTKKMYKNLRKKH